MDDDIQWLTLSETNLLIVQGHTNQASKTMFTQGELEGQARKHVQSRITLQGHMSASILMRHFKKPYEASLYEYIY
ncbi:MAG: hypothetical protein PHY45_08695 [Rhodocyclaceae bacterium]|nr:hypothetical protein [Rhodocyclaceae bacterium]